VHTALQLAPVVAAEKNKTAFYIAGGCLVAWALIVSLGIGLRTPSFPSGLAQQRLVMAITVLLVAAALSTAVITSGTAAKTSSSGATTTSTGATAPASTEPTATTGTPAPPSSPAASSKLSLAANPEGQLKYNTSHLEAKAGTVTITMTNMSPLEHNVTVEQGGKVLGATPTFKGGSKQLTLTLKAGTYKFFCSVPGHRQAGMEGTLTVTS
jgi:uncharacterized cupredoxin-like copper-binding protein